MKNLYTVKPGESPADVAQKYTGRRDRYRDLLVLNKHLRQTTDGMTGRAVFDKRDWVQGSGIVIPRYWADKGPMHSVSSLGSPYSGFVGEYDEDGYYETGSGTKTSSNKSGTCSQYVKEESKPYEVRMLQGEFPELVAQKWLGSLWEVGFGLYTTRTLIKAQPERFYSDCLTLKPGWMQLRIPANWPPAPESMKERRINPDGTAYIDEEPPAPPGPGDDLDRVDPGKGSGIDTVGAESGDSNTIWMLLAAGAAVAGGIFLYNSKKKTTR